MQVTGIVSSVSDRKTGLYLLVGPGLSGFVPALELSKGRYTCSASTSRARLLGIESRQERKQLNVWCGLLTLEMKYGSISSLQDTIDRACRHNNLKQKATNASPESVKRADEMFE